MKEPRPPNALFPIVCGTVLLGIAVGGAVRFDTSPPTIQLSNQPQHPQPPASPSNLSPPTPTRRVAGVGGGEGRVGGLEGWRGRVGALEVRYYDEVSCGVDFCDVVFCVGIRFGDDTDSMSICVLLQRQ